MKRLDRSDVQIVDERVRVRVRGKRSRIITLDDPALPAIHRQWMQHRMWCAYPAYFRTRKAGRITDDTIRVLTNHGRKKPPAQ